jgi:hypothetical protein
MKIITNIISILAMVFLVGDVFAECDENTTVLTVNGSVAAYKKILSVVPDNGISDTDVQRHSLDAGGVTTDGRCPADRTFDMCGIPDSIRLSVLLDYECRAP